MALVGAPETVWPELAALLDDSERARAARFKFDQHRHEFIAAHALKRLMLSSLGGGPPEAWAFETAERGKPHVGLAHRSSVEQHRGGPHFNISHCTGMVACAVSPSVELGIDVEYLGRNAPLEIVPNYFAPAEVRWLHSQPAAERSLGFMRLWTLKEACIKATGWGLSQRLQDFAFGFEPSLGVSFLDAALGDSRGWHFEQYPVGSEHLLALAWCGGDETATVTRRELRVEMLLAEAPPAT